VIGGAIDCQGWGASYAAPFPSNSIDSSQFTDNVAHGGAGGYSQSGSSGGTGGFVWGGDVCASGTLAISDSTFTGAQAFGGDGGVDHVAVSGAAGGSVLGGSLALLNTLITGGPSIVTDSLANVTVQGATAQGGQGGSGGNAGVGGAAEGGGIALSVPNNPSGHLSTSISKTTIANNTALGGTGGLIVSFNPAHAAGGDARAGGLFVDASSVVALDGGSITGNQADGGPWGKTGTDKGLGGGVYLAALGSTKKKTTISGNFASTSNPDIFGTFS
jgi:hypothetical protein